MMSQRVERTFWLVTAIALGIYGFTIAETWLYQRYLDWEFAERLAVPVPVQPTGIPASVARERKGSVRGEPIGRLEIPAIDLSAMIAEGVDSTTLRRSVGHFPETPLPGKGGNVSLSAHRDTFFRHLGELRSGDLISISTPDGRFEYAVESTGIVDPDERVVLRDVGRPTLTLITCYPFYFVGSAPKRFVIHAGLIGE